MKKHFTNYLHNYIPILIGLSILLISVKFIESYGFMTFLILPFFVGYSTTILLKKYRRDLSNLKMIILLSFFNIIIISLGTILIAIEGLICVLMAIPIFLFFSSLGAIITFLYTDKGIKNTTFVFLIISILIVELSFIEKENTPSVSKVTTSVVIDAPIEEVWENIITFPELQEPEELIFKAGITYPKDATIYGNGVGAVMCYNFTTGSSIKPITVWNAPYHLAFNILEQPKPMKEINYINFNTPHLNNYFNSQYGEFRLKRMSKNKTKLIGSTWYTHHVYPEFYWKLWSSEIIHTIHYRVLNHIKNISEN